MPRVACMQVKEAAVKVVVRMEELAAKMVVRMEELAAAVDRPRK